MRIIIVFLVWNILTGILSDIYFTCHEKFKKSKKIDEMNIQDLH